MCHHSPTAAKASMTTQRAPGEIDTGTIEADVLTRLEALEAKVDSLQTKNQDLRDTVEDQQTGIEDLQETVEDLQTENQDLRERIDKSENATGYAHERIDKIESGASDTTDVTPRVQADKNPVQADELTPLGQTVTLPEHAVDSLTKNQERARFVAKDIKQYGDMRLGELVISSGDIRKVLSAREETSIHWETVSRVIDFLDSMGKGDTTVKDRHGTIVCFDPEAVSKWSRSGHTVVSGDKGEV